MTKTNVNNPFLYIKFVVVEMTYPRLKDLVYFIFPQNRDDFPVLENPNRFAVFSGSGKGYSSVNHGLVEKTAPFPITENTFELLPRELRIIPLFKCLLWEKIQGIHCRQFGDNPQVNIIRPTDKYFFIAYFFFVVRFCMILDPFSPLLLEGHIRVHIPLVIKICSLVDHLDASPCYGLGNQLEGNRHRRPINLWAKITVWVLAAHFG